MQPIKNILPKAVATLERPTKADPRNTLAWGRCADFIVPKGDKQLDLMKEAAASFIDDIAHNRTPRWLSLLGTSGAGKTMLVKIIARFYRETRHMQINWEASKRTQEHDESGKPTSHGRYIRDRGGFINWGDAINNRMLKGDYDFLDDLRSYSFFAIDDIASEYDRHRALSASKLYNVFEGRLKKWTVITANLSLEQIGTTLDARIASRMLREGGVVVDVDVPDWNLRGIQA